MNYVCYFLIFRKKTLHEEISVKLNAYNECFHGKAAFACADVDQDKMTEDSKTKS